MNNTRPPFERYLVGLDLGQSTDYSTLAAVRQTAGKDTQGRTVPIYGLVHLQRWALKTSYVQIVADVKGLFEKNLMAGPKNPLDGATLITDRSGCGRPIFDSLLAAKVNAAACIGLTITSGGTDSGATVAKKNLVAGLVRVFGEQRLQVAAGLKLASAFVKELETFKTTTTAARHQTFGAEHGAHDDILCAVALAIHYGERGGVPSAGSGPGVHTPRGMFGFSPRFRGPNAASAEATHDAYERARRGLR